MAYNGVIDLSLADVETEPVTLADVKSYAKIDFNDEDTLITEFITAARETLELYTNLSFVKRQVTVIINNGCGGQDLPFGPVTGTPVFTDREGDSITDIKTDGLFFLSVECPQTDYIKAFYQGGYDTDELPKSLKDALMAQVSYMYEHRGDEVDNNLANISPAAKQLCVRYRRVFNEFFI